MLEVVEAFSPLLSVGIGSHSAVSRAARAPGDDDRPPDRAGGNGELPALESPASDVAG